MSEQGDKRAKPGESFGSFIGAVLLIFTIRWLIVEPYTIPSGSMIPGLLIHDHILVNKLAFGLRIPFSKIWLWSFDSPKRGEIIVFKSVGEENEYFMIKRVVGIPGDQIEIADDGAVILNGTPLRREPLDLEQVKEDQAPFYAVDEIDLGGRFEQYQFYQEWNGDHSYRVIQMKDAYRFGPRRFLVPEGHYFMMGDNRDNSKDSRYWKYLPFEHVLGRATYVWLSCQKTLRFAPFLCDPLQVRGGRFFHPIHEIRSQ